MSHVERERPVVWLDVFAPAPLEGNGLAVLLEADGVSDGQMLAFARETRLAETTFVQTARVAEADYRNRIWTVTEELPFAGHPSLGTAVAVAHAAGVEATTYRQETGAGVQPVTVERTGERRYRTSVLQERPELQPAPAPLADLLAAAGLAADDLDPELAPELVTTGLPTLIVPLRDVARLAAARPDRERIAALPAPLGSFNFYLAVVDAAGGTARVRSIPSEPEEAEDPATGSAAGTLGALVHARLGLDRLRIEQGAGLGRPSVLEVAMEDGRPRVAGDVVVLMTGRVWF